MNLLTILAFLSGALAKYGPALLAAEQAFAAGGWAGLEKYLLSLLNAPTTNGPPKALVQRLLDKVKPMAEVVKSGQKTALKATCCCDDGCCCCLQCAWRRCWTGPPTWPPPCAATTARRRKREPALAAPDRPGLPPAGGRDDPWITGRRLLPRDA